MPKVYHGCQKIEIEADGCKEGWFARACPKALNLRKLHRQIRIEQSTVVEQSSVEQSSVDYVVEQSSVVQPYQFEPVADSDYEEDETDEDGILRETLEARFTKTVAVSSWYVSLTKQSNIKAFLELFISVFRLTFELILGAHVGIVVMLC